MMKLVTILILGLAFSQTSSRRLSKIRCHKRTADINSQLAKMVMDAAIAKSKDVGVKMNIAIVDAGANLKAFARMDGAWLGSIGIAMKKAKTARMFDMPTENIGQISQPNGELFNIEHSNGGLITFGGGIPIKCNGQIIGAIGVSGSSVANDIVVAQAGLDAIN